MPVAIKEISFHRSLNNRSIKLLSTPFPPAFPPRRQPSRVCSGKHSTLAMQIASSIFRRDDFLQPFLKWVFMYHHFYETFPRVSFIPGMLGCRRRIHKEEDFKHHFPRNLCVRHVMHEVKLNGAENLHHVKNGIAGSVPCLACHAGSDSGTRPNTHNTAQQIKSNPFSHLDFRNGNKICFRRSERDTKKINENMS